MLGQRRQMVELDVEKSYRSSGK